MSRPMTIRKGRHCRVKSDIRMWLDRVIVNVLRAVQQDHPHLKLSDGWAINTLRKRIAGSISDGLEKKLQKYGIEFPQEVGGEDK